MTTNHPRQQLHYIIAHYGRSVCDDPKRCEALLKDLCPHHKREVNLLMGALREGIAKELLKPNQLLPIETVISRLGQKLHDELGFEIGLAQWAVESWEFALGITFNSAVIAHSPDMGKVGMGSQVAAPIMHVNQPSQAMIDQFKGWQKIGSQGEKLAVDAPQWAAAINEKTNLMWAVNPSKTADFPNLKEKKTWDEAQAWAKYVNTQSWCGYKDWRLPTIDELKTLLVPLKYQNLYLRQDILTDIDNAQYWVWSSSPIANNSRYAWIVDFKAGHANHHYYHHYKNNNYYMRLVRSV